MSSTEDTMPDTEGTMFNNKGTMSNTKDDPKPDIAKTWERLPSELLLEVADHLWPKDRQVLAHACPKYRRLTGQENYCYARVEKLILTGGKKELIKNMNYLSACTKKGITGGADHDLDCYLKMKHARILRITITQDPGSLNSPHRRLGRLYPWDHEEPNPQHLTFIAFWQ
ncbi:hypothetical protein F5Y15DRAFT_419422 [Xylariaceae sp. FL0016]|nr:hypothetical protein F5Y15DRAFT_419422 [Xylariaceae sp. FL0016]